MAVGTRPITVEEFDRLVTQPENAGKRLEYIGGEVVEVVSDNYASAVAIRIAGFIFMYLTEHEIGYITGADGGYQVGDERYIPNVAFVSKTRLPEPSREAYASLAPDLAVEVLSPSNDPGDMRLKLSNYLAAGTVVWVVDPEKQFVEVHSAGQPAQRLGVEDTLNGGDVLPGFTLTVQDIFPE